MIEKVASLEVFTFVGVTYVNCAVCSWGQKSMKQLKMGKIPGDGRKFLDRFKLFWVTDIITIVK